MRLRRALITAALAVAATVGMSVAFAAPASAGYTPPCLPLPL